MILNLKKIFSKYILLDIFAVCIILLMVIGAYRVIELQNAMGLFDYLVRSVLRALFAASPLLILYFIFRLLHINALSALILTSTIFFILHRVHRAKYKITGDPLSYGDLLNVSNTEVAIHYVPAQLLVGLVALLILLVLSFLLTPASVKSYRPKTWTLCLLLFFSISIASPYHLSQVIGPGGLAGGCLSLEKKLNMHYSGGWLAQSVDRNGLLRHLVQTSIVFKLEAPTQEDSEKYNAITHEPRQEQMPQRNVIYILCESCWYDENNFKELFDPLIEQKFEPFRLTSPVYAGGTVKTESEVLTGLPSRTNVLSGMLYQEYAYTLKNNASNLAHDLKQQGYSVFALHNFKRQVWRRHIVFDKFGFDAYVDLSQMSPSTEEMSERWQPDDRMLYESALEILKNHREEKLFLHLITMTSHGPYDEQNDFGEASYQSLLSLAMSRLEDFIKQVNDIDPEAIIFIYGDHMPGLTKYFYERGVFDDELTISTGKTNLEARLMHQDESRRNVPAFLRTPEPDLTKQIIEEINGEPFFCVTPTLDHYFYNTDSKVFPYMREHVCREQVMSYEQKVNCVPQWLYAKSLFYD